jgi:type VI secretion system protein ImpK
MSPSRSSSSPTASTSADAGAAGHPVPSGFLARSLEVALTAIARLRAGRQSVDDVGAFRAHMVHALEDAAAGARAQGYTPEDARLAEYAVVALLDESVLHNPRLASVWAQRPLQDERYGQHLAGEWFFQHIEQLLARPDSLALADVLEVYQLCLQLGFRGRYGGDSAALSVISSQIGARLARLRGAPMDDLAPAWRPRADAVASFDPWIRPLAIGFGAAIVLAIAIWGAGRLSLGSATNNIRQLAPAPAATRAAS